MAITNGVTFGNIHSYNDLNLLLKSIEIETPKAKISKLDIEGADGEEDVTNALTDIIFYKNRKIKCVFTKVHDNKWYNTHLSKILNSINGKNMHVILDDDPTWYYEARISVDEADSDRVVDEVTVSCDCKPYKLSYSETCRRYDIKDSMSCAIDYIGTKTLTPIIDCVIDDGNTLELVVETIHYTLSNGENIVPNFVLKEGSNEFSFIGNGFVKLTYREGVL